MALDPSIALGVKPLEVANPVAQYAQMTQLQGLQNQNEVSQMQLEGLKRERAVLDQIRSKSMENGGPADLNEIASAYIKSGDPKFMEFGIGLFMIAGLIYIVKFIVCIARLLDKNYRYEDWSNYE